MLVLRLSGRERSVVLFEGWIFVQVKPGWQVLCSTRGISRVITQNDVPVRVPDRDIQALRDREINGFVSLAPRLSVGDRARVENEDSAFFGKDGLVETVDAAGRVCVLMRLMGRVVRPSFDPRELRAA